MGNGSSTATPKPAGRAGPARATTAEDPSPGLIQPLQSQHSRRVVSVRPLQQPSGVRSQQEQKPILGRLPESDPVALRLAVSSTLSGQDHSSQSAGIGPDSVFAEALRHATFCRAVAEKCSDRDDAVKLIYSFVTTWSCGNTGVETLYLGGLSGSGKSVVLSKAICDASSHLTALTASILLRHVGLTQESSDPLLLVASLCLQQNVFPLPTCRSQIPKALANLLSSASEDKPILMVLDGVDSFWDPSNSTLSWLIPALESVRGNPFVRVVLTGRDSNGSPAEIALRRSLDSLQCVSLRPLTVCEEVQAGQAFAILRKLLSAASSGSLSEDLAESVHTAFKLAKSSFVGVTPLYIRLVLEAFLLPNAYQQNMKGTKSRPATASSMPLVSTIPATTQECVDWCLTLMEGSCGTDRENDVISILTAITASRDGLSLQQLSRVLSTSDSVSVNTLLGAIQSVPGGFLVQPATGTDLFKWAHSLAREIAEYRYMGCLKPSDRLVGPISELMDKRQRQKSALSKSVDTLVNGAENHLSDLLSAGTLLGNCVQRSNPSELLRSMALSRRWDELTNLVKDIDFVISLCKSVGGWENVARELMVIGLTVESTCPPASEADSSGTNCAEWLSAAADVFHEKQSLLDVAAAADATLVKSVLMQELEKEIDGSKRIQVIQEYVKGAKANSAKIMFICDETENPRSEVVCARPEYLVLAGTLDSSCDILATALDGSTVAVVVNGIEIRVFRGHDLRERWTYFSESAIMDLGVSSDGLYLVASRHSSVIIFSATKGHVCALIDQPQKATVVSQSSTAEPFGEEHNSASGFQPKNIGFALDGSVVASDSIGDLHLWYFKKLGSEAIHYETKSVGSLSKHGSRRKQKPFLSEGAAGKLELLQRQHPFRWDTDGKANGLADVEGHSRCSEKRPAPPIHMRVAPDGSSVIWWEGGRNISGPNNSLASLAAPEKESTPLTHSIVCFDVPQSTRKILAPPPMMTRWRSDGFFPLLWGGYTPSGLYFIVVGGEGGASVTCHGTSTGKVVWRTNIEPAVECTERSARGSLKPLPRCVGVGIVGENDEAVVAVTSDGWAIDISNGRIGGRMKVPLAPNDHCVGVDRLVIGPRREPEIDGEKTILSRVRRWRQAVLISTALGHVMTVSVKPLLRSSSSPTRNAQFCKLLPGSVHFVSLFKQPDSSGLADGVIVLASDGSHMPLTLAVDARLQVSRDILQRFLDPPQSPLRHLNCQEDEVTVGFRDGELLISANARPPQRLYLDIEVESLRIVNSCIPQGRTASTDSVDASSETLTSPPPQPPQLKNSRAPTQSWVLALDTEHNLHSFQVGNGQTPTRIWTVEKSSLAVHPEQASRVIPILGSEAGFASRVLVLTSSGCITSWTFNSGNASSDMSGQPMQVDFDSYATQQFCFTAADLIYCPLTTGGSDNASDATIIAAGDENGVLRTIAISNSTATIAASKALHAGSIRFVHALPQPSGLDRTLGVASPKNCLVLTCGEDGLVIVWDASDLSPTAVAEVGCEICSVDVLALDAGNSGASTIKIAVGGADGRVHALNLVIMK